MDLRRKVNTADILVMLTAILCAAVSVILFVAQSAPDIPLWPMIGICGLVAAIGFSAGYLVCRSLGKLAAKILESERTKRVLVCLTFVTVGAMCLYPPWLRTASRYGRPTYSNSIEVKQPLQSYYAFLLRPPAEFRWEDDSVMAKLSPYDRLIYKRQWFIVTTIDIRKLLVQCAIVICVGGALAALCRSKDKTADK